MPQKQVRPHRSRLPQPSPTSSGRLSSWDAAVNAFLSDCRRRNLSPSTTDTYLSILTSPRTEEFRKDHQLQSARDLTAETLKAFETELFEAGLSSGSVMGYHRVLKTFGRFCLTECCADDEALLQVDGPKREQYEPEVFTEDEERQLVAACDNDRDRFLIEFMMATGLRLSEVVNVTLDDIVESPNGAYVRVRQGKGRKDRIVPLDTAKNRMSRKLRRYIEHTRPKDTSETALFICKRSSKTAAPVIGL
jgi:site-specific recombinase XerD